MREERVHASDGLFGIQGVHLVFGLAIFFGDGANAQDFRDSNGSAGFGWIARMRTDKESPI